MEKILMRIALLPDDYLPSSTLVHAKMFHELAHEFMKQGHDVVVITPGLPEQNKKLIIEVVDGVTVWRFRAGLRRGVGKFKRAINESLLSFHAWGAIKGEVNKAPFDLCVNYSPTIFFGNLTAKFRRKYDTYIYLVLRDLFPQWVIDEGMIKKDSLIAKFFRYFEHLNYKSSNKIGLMSKANIDYFSSINPQYKNTEVLLNWASLVPSKFENYSIDVREEHNLTDKVIFFYGGNIGHAQDMANLLRLAERLKCIPEAHFLFVGQGDEFELINRLKTELKLNNVTILPSVNQSQYKEILTQVDIGLFSLAKTHQAHNFPGKLLGYMVQSLPILGSVNAGNDLIGYINDSVSGFAFINGNDDDLSRGAIELLKNLEVRRQMGLNSYELLKQNFSVEQAARKIILAMEEQH
ncbi:MULTISPECIES: glycosyltransferase family 4 protein [unclassified Pseudoalteromonas]|uniref:glycosyltransferase family 4 protein n=1 Tax=unclassified Pseudoalteromonas TaxID=194690 RepID=UPI0025B55DC0|nr:MULTISPECIES: glycosyltransferase family 4 protein [unclassified Pseudoalteromonas]MDN3379133.1 glycosyltransferase family 4 protein [Pseudoalteromonas sp. APC 3893]MDN3389226.1 glycosyltransferase family 4 protein [Pseudoalteromonas sp. APC 4017]